MASDSTSPPPKQQRQSPPSAPATAIDFLQASLFLEDPDLPKEQRTSTLKFIGVIGAIVAYVAAVFMLIIVACIVTPLVPALNTAFGCVLRLLTAPESWFKSAYEYQGPVVRLTRLISSRVMSAFNRRSSTVGVGDSMPPLQRLVSRSSYAATM